MRHSLISAFIVTIAQVVILSATARALAITNPPLSSHQQKIHDEVKAGLESVDAALTDARAKFDAGDTNGATAAYGAAVRNYNNHVRRLGQLPSDEPSVAALREQAQTLGAKMKETAAALRAVPSNQPGAKPTEKSAEKPAEKPTGKPAAPDAASSLGYPDREKLKNARFYLKEIDPRVERIVELAAAKLDADLIAEANNHMTFARQRLGYVLDNLNALPADNADVAVERKRYDEALAKLDAAKSAIDKAAPEANKQLAALGEQMNSDLSMVDSWSKSLGDPQSLFSNRPDDAIAVVGQLPEMRTALGDMVQRWTARSKEKPNDQTAAEMVRKLGWVNGKLTELETYTKGQATALPDRIAADLAEVSKLIGTAVSEKLPAYFSKDGGIAHTLTAVEARVKMLRAIDAPAAQRAELALSSARQKSNEAQKSLAQDIISANEKPAERYAGPDVEELRQRVIATWKEAHPTDEIVAVIFNTEGWARTTRWDWNTSSKSFSKVDYDYIQPKLFYKLDDKYAVEQPVDIYKDYMKDGRIAAKPWEREAEPPAGRMYLLENLK